MSEATTPTDNHGDDSEPDDDVVAFVDDHRDRIERLADSNLPIAADYQYLLEYVDDE